MGVGIFVLGIIAVLGTFSLYRSGKKNTLIKKVVQDYLDEQGFILVSIEKPMNSGPFKDDYYDRQASNLYQNLGYQANETVYRQIIAKNANGADETIWLLCRVENLQATYIEWKS